MSKADILIAIVLLLIGCGFGFLVGINKKSSTDYQININESYYEVWEKGDGTKYKVPIDSLESWILKQNL